MLRLFVIIQEVFGLYAQDFEPDDAIRDNRGDKRGGLDETGNFEYRMGGCAR